MEERIAKEGFAWVPGKALYEGFGSRDSEVSNLEH